MPYNILQILPTAEHAGTSLARIVCALANGVDSRRYRVHACFFGEDGPLRKDLEDAGVQVRMVPWNGIKRDPGGTRDFWKQLRSNSWAIIHQHSGGASVRWLAKFACGSKIIVHMHGTARESDPTAAYHPRLRNAHAVIATSQATAKLVKAGNIRVIYPGVEVAGNDPASDLRQSTKLYVGTAGRLVPIKGLTYLIRAIALLRNEFPHLRLEIAGTGPEQPRLECEILSNNISDQVEFLGWRTDMTSAMRRWNVFVIPSLEEGFGIACLEAMGVGLPVIATAVGGLPELVEHGRTGWLVPPGDASAIAECLRPLLLDAELRRNMGIAGQIRARNKFSLKQMVREISNVYDELLSLST